MLGLHILSRLKNQHHALLLAIISVLFLVACDVNLGVEENDNTQSPPAPANLQATSGDGEVDLTWTGVTGASYIVHQAQEPLINVADYNTLAGYKVYIGITTTSKHITRLANDTKYYFVVTAVKNDKKSLPSYQAHATPVPDAGHVTPYPTKLRATPGDAEIRLTWIGVKGASYIVHQATESFRSVDHVNNFDTLTGYKIYTGVTATSKNITGLVNGTDYYFVVTALKNDKKSLPSYQAHAVPSIADTKHVPPYPTNLQATPGDREIYLTWKGVKGVSYIIHQAKESFRSVDQIDDYDTLAGYTVYTKITATSKSITRLVNGTDYYFVVTALKNDKQSLPSYQAHAVPVTDASHVSPYPTNLTITPGDREVYFTWTGVKGASYTIHQAKESFRKVDHGDNYNVLTGYKKYPGIATTSKRITGLVNGVGYYYVVTATKNGKESPYVRQFYVVPQLAAPTASSDQLVVGTGYFHAVAHHPDADIQKIVVGTTAGLVQIYDYSEGAITLMQTMSGHTGNVDSVAYSPDGTQVVSGGWDSNIYIWDIATGDLVRSFKGHRGRVYSVAFSPDGTKLVSGGGNDYTVRIWDATTGRSIHTMAAQYRIYNNYNKSIVYSVAFSPDGKQVVSGGDIQAQVWDVATGAPIRKLYWHIGVVYALAYSPDGRQLVTGSNDRTVRIWDATTGTQIRSTAKHGNTVFSVAYSPDGSKLASGSTDKKVRLWNAATGDLIHTLGGHTGPVYATVFSPDGSTLVSGSTRSIRIWDTATGQAFYNTLQAPQHTPAYALAFSPDGSKVASSNRDSTVRTWDATTGKLLRTMAGDKNIYLSVAYSPDGSKLASGGADKGVRLWDTATGRLIYTLPGHTDNVRSVAFSPDGNTLASGGADRSIRLWNTTTGAWIRTITGHTDRVRSIAFSPDGSKLVSGSDDNSVRLWEAATGDLIRTMDKHNDGVRAVAFSPDGNTLASGSDDSSIRLWDAATGELLHTRGEHTDWIYSVAFSPDGSKLVSGSADKSIRLWDTATGRLISTMVGHTNDVVSVAFSPNGSRVASVSKDRTMRLWELTK